MQNSINAVINVWISHGMSGLLEWHLLLFKRGIQTQTISDVFCIREATTSFVDARFAAVGLSQGFEGGG